MRWFASLLARCTALFGARNRTAAGFFEETRTRRDQGADLSPLRNHRGFTLIELIVTVGIVGVVMAVTVPALLRARMSGNEYRRSLRSARSTPRSPRTPSVASEGNYASDSAILVPPLPGRKPGVPVVGVRRRPGTEDICCSAAGAAGLHGMPRAGRTGSLGLDVDCQRTKPDAQHADSVALGVRFRASAVSLQAG